MSLNESHLEEAALEWLAEFGYALGHGPDMAPTPYPFCLKRQGR
jgi:hypothetical protein